MEEAPSPDLMATLLKSRYEMDRRYGVSVEVGETAPRRISVVIERPKRGHAPADSYRLEVQSAAATASWTAIVDCADALVGMLVEAEYAHRQVPVGPGLEFGQNRFNVQLEYLRPDIDRSADAMLTEN